MRSIDMKYSVLMPVYRKENPFYFYRAALSMMKQSVSPDEFVLVCDGPLTEELDAVIRKLEETWSEQVKIVRLPENRGIGPALAAGVESCRNNLIARMDSDDIACPERCEKQLVQFRGNPALALASGAIAEFEMDSLEKAANMQWTIDTPKEPVEIPEDCCITGTRTLPCGYEEILIFARRRNPMNHMAVMMRRDAVLAVGNYREGCRRLRTMGADAAGWLSGGKSAGCAGIRENGKWHDAAARRSGVCERKYTSADPFL